MDRERFEQLIAAYGADPARWPEGERAQGLRLAARSEWAEPLAEQRALDAALGAWSAEAPSLALRARLAAAMPDARRERRRWWWSGAGLAAACAAGLVVGASLGGAGPPPTSDRDGEALTGGFGGVAVFGAPLDLGAAS